ncbi:MAG TPA: ABC transporter ATP-binding protein, partial [Polyangiaceae bacterium]|nr:ABC transporter ATP-binding protein [Polyangiaceae bacterium]
EAKTYAVREVTFEARFREMLYIVGPSGSGKTTLLSMISGILRPDSGTVRMCDTNLWALNENALADFRLGKIGFVFQDFHLFPNLTTIENIAIPLVLKRREWREAMREAARYLDIVGLGARGQLNPTRLSGGEQQRVAIARALASGPDVMIFDEPTASLDGDTGRKIVEFVKQRVLGEGRCIVVVTHDDRIYEFADRILHMEDGRLLDGKGDADA